MQKIEKIISLIRENMTTSGGSPTNNIGDGNIKTFNPLMQFKRRTNGKVDRRSSKREYDKWLKSLNQI